MPRKRLLKTIKRLLWQASHSRHYLPAVFVMALMATLSMTVPVTAVLTVSVMLRPQRWRLVCVAAVLGAATGASLIAWGFQQEGWHQVQAAYPELARSASWLRVKSAVADYGLPALALICALPLPQTPALIVSALADPPLAGIFMAVAAGKLAKYGVVAWMVATFPERFIHYLHRDDESRESRAGNSE